MPTIHYQADNFPRGSSAALTGRHSIDVTWNEIVWAAVTVGKRGFDDLLAHHVHSLDEIMYRAYMVWANLWEQDGAIHRSPAYDDLDPTEKGAISYFLGMTIAKLFAWRLFSAPWMVHLDRLVDYHTVGLNGRSRPDLAGKDLNRRWILVEGKGRTGNYSQAAMDQAKAQVAQVRDIDGARPLLRVGAQTYFASALTVQLVDPESSERDSVSLKIDEGQFRDIYYRRFVRIRSRAQRQRTIRGRPHRFVDFESIGVSVGVDVNAERRLDVRPPRSDFQGAAEVDPAPDGRMYEAYLDGIAIGLDPRWSASSMEKKPIER